LIKRTSDIIFSLIGIVVLLPFFFLVSLFILLDSKGGIFFKQVRVGRGNKDFYLYKFRTMRSDSEKRGQLTIGSRDNRITRVGYYLRKLKLDELPQLINVLKGDMSLVGPRPEVRKYVNLYTDEQLKVLSVRPGITDYASIKYFSESDLLAKSSNPEKTYIEEIMPEKLKINLEYVNKNGFFADMTIVFKTLGKIIRIK